MHTPRLQVGKTNQEIKFRKWDLDNKTPRVFFLRHTAEKESIWKTMDPPPVLSLGTMSHKFAVTTHRLEFPLSSDNIPTVSSDVLEPLIAEKTSDRTVFSPGKVHIALAAHALAGLPKSLEKSS